MLGRSGTASPAKSEASGSGTRSGQRTRSTSDHAGLAGVGGRRAPVPRGAEPRLRAPRPPPHLHAASPRAPPARDGGRAAVVAGSFPVSPGADAPAPPAQCKHTPREGRGGAAPWQPRPEEEARGSGAAIFGEGGSGCLPSGSPPLTLGIVCVVTAVCTTSWHLTRLLKALYKINEMRLPPQISLCTR